MTDWVSAGAVLAAGVILGLVFFYSMKRRAASPDTALRELEARRDALVAELRELPRTEENAAERARLEREAANALRLIDGQTKRGAKPQEPQPVAVARQAAIKGFAWGGGSVLVLAGIGWWVMQQAQPKAETAPQAAAVPMQQPPQADHALQQIEAAVAKDPNDLALRNQLARAYLERDNLMAVFDQTQYVLQRQPSDAQALTYQAMVRVAMGQSDVAAAMLHKAIKSDPALLDAYVALAWEQMTAGKTDEAEATISEAKKRHPEQQARLADVLARMREQVRTRASAPTDHPAVEPPGAATEAAAAPPSDAVHVTLQLAAGTAQPERGVIFVTARPAGVTAGPPAAVKRLPLGALPLSFDLSAADSMMGQPLPPKLRIEARVDSDGDPLTKDPRDPSATVDNVAKGSSTTLVLH